MKKAKFITSTDQSSFFWFAFSLNSVWSGADARKFPPDPKERVKQNIEQGKGFRMMDSMVQWNL